jgi:predicted glycoside hydrolase/deacetylase ChbG (UPF0249 family)
MNDTIRLIINADDLGSGEPTDRGIIESFTSGIVSSASILANGPSFDSAVEQVCQSKLPVGVHLNLSEGYALTAPISGLTDEHGQFPGKTESRQRFLTGNIDRDQIQRELLAQINKVKAAGLHPDHLDTHQHSGLFPVITTPLIFAAKEAGIRRMRIPKPILLPNEKPPPPLGDELRLYRQLAPVMAERLKAAGILTPDGLLGMPLLDRLDGIELAHLLANLKPGIWELMVHPGYFDPEREFSGPERVQELSVLTSHTIKSMIQQHNIRLTNFLELPCTS